MTIINKLLIAILIVLLWIHFEKADSPIPDPTPNAHNMRVCVVVESQELSTSLNKEQLTAINSAEIREYLNSHCAKETSGTPAYKIYDKDTDLSQVDTGWAKAIGQAKELPWIYIQNGRKVASQPLPKSYNSIKDLLEKYGGK